ncbi:MAG TPA: hypothetical protein VNB29_03110, partial [Chthoniobacterales bacterium]|nr:hypothetical protein [Chthoniobacterales bacterium]
MAREEPAAAVSASPIARLVWADAADTTSGDVSPDGRSLAFVDRETGDLAVRDLATGKNRRLTNKGSWSQSIEFALSPKFSADGTQLAYSWFNEQRKFDLRVIRVEGGDPRVVYSDKDGRLFPDPCGWTPDDNAILATLTTLRPGGESRNPGTPPAVEQRPVQLALIDKSDGSLRVVKSLESGKGLGDRMMLMLSPDGRTIAYSQSAEPGSPNHNIFLIDVASGQETPVTTHVAKKRILAWTPDGRGLLYAMEQQGAWDAWLIRIVGGKPQGEAELVKKDLGMIVPLGFTRAGTLYYGTSASGPSLYTATLDWEQGAATATPLAAEKFNILDRLTLGDWSPDGENLAYVARRSQGSQEIRIVSTKTGQTRVLKPDLKSQSWRGVRWSPDGRSFIADTGAAVGQKPGIYQFDAVSGQAMPVVEAGGCSQLVWSPDRKGIFYLMNEGILDLLAGKARIVYRDLQSQTEKEVLTPGNPAFTPRFDFWFNPSPDGRQIALLGEPNADSMALWLVPLVGGASRELLKVNTPGTFAGGVGWTPDGRFILFTQLGGDEKERGLWYISASGGEPRKVALTGVEAKNVTRLAIHPDGKQLALDVRGTGISEVWAL